MESEYTIAPASYSLMRTISGEAFDTDLTIRVMPDDLGRRSSRSQTVLLQALSSSTITYVWVLRISPVDCEQICIDAIVAS